MIPAFVGHHRRAAIKDPLDTLAVPVKGPVGGANETLAVYAINSFIVLFQDSDQLTLEMKKKIQQQQQQYTASFSFLSFFFPLVTAVGNTIREESPHVTESKTVLDSGFHALNSGFPVLDSRLLVKFGFWIPIFSRVPVSLSCIPDSKAQNFRESGIQISLTWSEKRRRLQSTP